MSKKTIFISYSHKDLNWLEYVGAHLKYLDQFYNIEIWADTELVAGENWRTTLEARMLAADAAIFLVTVNFINSKFIQDVEVPKLLKKRASNGMPIWPVIARPCAWEKLAYLSETQKRPRRAHALSGMKMHDRDLAMVSFADEVHLQLKPLSKAMDGDARTTIELRSDKNFPTQEQQDLLRRLQESLPEGEKIEIKRVKKGSVRLFVELTEQQLELLKTLFQDGFLDSDLLEMRGPLSERERRGLEVFSFRDQLVVRDETVARLFGVETKHLNQALRRNEERFDEKHAFQLSDDEWSRLKSQIVTTKRRGGTRTAPHMFTEAGVVMASTVLRSPKAIAASKFLVQVFLEARRSQNNSLSRISGGDALAEGLEGFDAAEDE